MSYKWVLCDNKISTLCDIMNGLIDVRKTEYQVVTFDDNNVCDLFEYHLGDLRDFVTNEDIELFKKVVDNDE